MNCQITLKNDVTTFDTPSNEIIINIGYKFITDKLFKAKLPTSYQVEQAIMYIEDAITEVVPQWQENNMTEFNFSSDDEWIHSTAKTLKITRNTITREEIELLFNQVVDVITGRPKHMDEFPDSIDFISQLLIGRELIHHLKIEKITIL